MSSHGVPRIQPVVERTEEQLRKERAKIDAYQSLVKQIQDAIQQKDYSENTLALTSNILTQNPEYYTAWNNRRRILQHIFNEASQESEQHEQIKSRIKADLEFIFPLQLSFPKCYWIWNHRLWLLQQASLRLLPSEALKFWQGELLLVGKMLARDNRNFHGWDYRRRVVAEIEKLNASSQSASTDEDDAAVIALTKSEFDYTTKMIKTDLSNFSAWHNRSKLLPKLLNEREASDVDRQKTFDSELSLSRDAVLFDPYDQSLWFYHQFLMSMLQSDAADCFVPLSNKQRLEYLEKEITSIRELLEDTDDCKYVYQYLLYYISLYLNIDGGNKFVTTVEMRSWLTKLKELDEMRIGRWNDLQASLNLT